MNSKQKFAFLLGVIAIAMMGLMPPWKEAGPKGLPLSYGPIYAPPMPLNPDKGMEIDFVRLFLQVGVAAVLSGGLVAAGASPPQKGGGTAGNIPGSPWEAIQQRMKEQQEELAKQQAALQAKPAAVEVVEQEDEDEEEDEDEDEEEEEEVEDDGFNILRLPAGRTYGEFLVESDDDPDYWETLTTARGVVRLPADKRVQLETPKGGKEVDLSFVSLLSPDTLYSIDLSESKLNDWELANLQKLTELKELDLSSSSISSQALSYLKGLDKLEKLWLDETKVDDSCLDDLKRFDSLKKLSIKGTKITADGTKQLQEKLSDCKIET